MSDYHRESAGDGAIIGGLGEGAIADEDDNSEEYGSYYGNDDQIYEIQVLI